MTVLSDFVFRIVSGTVLCSLLTYMFPEGKMKILLRTFSGVYLLMIILSGVHDVEIVDYKISGREYIQQAQSAAAVGEDYTQKRYLERIKNRVETYIFDKGRSLGCELSVEAEVGPDGYPISVKLSGFPTDKEQEQISVFLEEELGITKEDQHWNGQ